MAGLRFNIFATDKTKGAFNSVKKNVGGLKAKFDAVKGSLKGMGPLIVAAFAGASIRAVINVTDKVQKFALITQISTEALSELKFAGEQSGVEFDKLQVAIRKTGKSVSDANRGLATQVDAFADLGLKAQDLLNLPLDEQFQIIGDKLRGVSNQSDKLRISMDIMGRSGSELLAMFDSNSDSIAELRQELRSLGGVIEQDQADALAGLNDAWNRIKTAFDGIVRVILTALGPAFELLMNIIASTIAFIGKAIRTVLLLDDAIASLIVTVGNFFGLVSDETEAKVLNKMKGQWDSIWDSTKGATSAVKKYKREVGNLPPLDGGSVGVKKTTGKKSETKEKMTDAEKQAAKTMENIGDTFKGGLRDAMTDFDNFGDHAIDTIKKIGEIMTQNQFDQVFDGLFGGKKDGKSGGGILDSILGGFGDMFGGGGGIMSGISSMFSGGFGGFFEKGGSFNAGKPIIVGENGPEMIMPKGSGTVTPNHKMGGSPVNVVMNIQTPDANSFRQSQAQMAASMAMQIEVAQRRNL